ncbi:hypothetical protein LTR91_006417 [Friedmanniomyces endolithicus]|uniref:Ribosomal protein S2 n=1 Tax=Friedmanniomyces endolithicus TaxID=329885 RepID=A0A4U0V4M5_9PEZI|nr:hypothetical protein LTS09_010884 [Friedmanniomyces endolithicus]KAK0290227.1 hypothetical protein LTR35_002169 [Friedmanniomyces endolithicus]KAK0299788.1 hypothetical protein LTS00_001558 [Friedmanniomyces endolithicus]KAK0305133.1 hypothetical protein LTR01_006991 [Friedmanniomyces endolithicus]KAK0319265.1 hypothetical protein LTR82_009682 [Friedmanniomyces endolithicus]
MILRSLLLRHGRAALSKPPTPFRSWRRHLASEVEQTYTNSHANQNYIAGGTSGTNAQAVSSLTTPSASSDQIKLDWEFFHHQKSTTRPLGTSLTPHYKPHELLSNPPRPEDITLELLLASQAHIGHSTSLWHPANAKYIFGVRGREDPIHIISLDATAAYLRRACKVVRGVAERGGLVLFVGSREGQAGCVVKAAKLAGGCHLFTKWIPGSITNGQQILGKCAKRVVNHLDESVPGFEKQLLRRAAVKPDLVVCLNMLENYVLLHECALNNIPTVGVLDTDCNPTWVTYPIPANDDSLRCVQVIAGVLGRAGEEGQAARLRSAGRGDHPARQDHGLEAPSEEDVDATPLEREMALLRAAEAFEEEGVVAGREGEDGEADHVDASLTGAGGPEEDGVDVPYERDAPIEGGADERVEFSPVVDHGSKVGDEGEWATKAEHDIEQKPGPERRERS